ncbi:hypothetical protein [Burkholderia sp. BCC1988]|uniref:hypothetical protein n=1 Tax=Burkholderia sp. BCC1988 TaxID=2817443 RepID=UPI002AB250FC|nr:hypothetical protein [Burkholderia sp. BCC1988]
MKTVSMLIDGEVASRAPAAAAGVEDAEAAVDAAARAFPIWSGFGPLKRGSGFWCFGGRAGVAEFTDLRGITLQTTLHHDPF